MTEYPIQLSGGLDTETSALKKAPGNLIGVENYESKVEGGYDRVRGYERYDGRPAPSAAEITIIGCDGTWASTAIVTASVAGALSGATGVICYATSTIIAVTKVTGTFLTGENITISGTAVGISRLEPSVTQGVLNAMYAGAAAIYRTDITTVPGEGPVCGVCVVDDTVFAFRNNVGSTAQVVWQATSAGWVAITYPNLYKVGFTVGSGTYSGGADTLTQGGNTAVVHRVQINSGSFDAGDAEGWLILRAASTPGALSGGAASMTGATMTLSSGFGAYQAATLLPSGRWQFVSYQFTEIGAVPVGIPAYGVDLTEDGTGGGNFIEFDGQCAIPISTGNNGLGGPSRIAAHKNHLWIGLRRSLWFSGINNPYSWSVFTGGGEIGIGSEATNMRSLQGSEDQGAMLVLCDNKSMVIYGNDATDWKMVPLSQEVGAKAYSAQQLGQALAFDEQGVRDFSPTQAFGNFAFNELTNHIKRKLTGLTVTASVISKKLGRYRLFFDDGSFLVGTPGKRWSWTFGRYPFTVLTAYEAEIDGESRIFMTGSDGYVYEADVGRSFDGVAIEAWMKTAYAHMGKPGMRKAWRRFDVDIVGESSGEIKLQPDFSYGDTAIDQGLAARYTDEPIPPPASPWDIGQWDTGAWDGQYLSRARFRLPGVGENVSLLFYSNSAQELSHTVQSVSEHFLPRRKTR